MKRNKLQTSNQAVTIEDRAINTDFIRIQNREQFITKVPSYHGEDPRYARFWSREIKRCVEGRWGKMFGGYRYMRGPTYFYGNYFLLQETDRNKQTIYMKPKIDDLEWELSYYIGVCRGFSGFEKDTKYTCIKDVKNYLDSEDQLYTLDYLQKYYPDAFYDGELKEYVDPYEYIRKIHPKPLGRALYQNQTYNGQVGGSRGGGKALTINELCRVEGGWKTMGDLSVGDKVYGRDGELCNVTWKSAIEKAKYYQLTFRDGRTIDACEDHSWLVWDKNKNRKKKGKYREDNYTVVSTKEMVSKYYYERIDSKHRKKYGEDKYCREYIFAVPLNDPLNLPEKKLPIDPYILGILLGDGSIPVDNGISVETPDEMIIDALKAFCDSHNFTYRITRNDHKKSDSFYITNKNNQPESLKDILSTLGLIGCRAWEKFIPKNYLNGSYDQRIELLRGIMDADGFADATHIEFMTSSPQLSKDVQELIRSLGMGCRTVEKDTHYTIDGERTECRIAYRTSIYTDQDVFKLERQLSRINKDKSKAGKSKWSKNFIVDIQSIGDQEGCCITVDNHDHTYITKDYIVTHNSYSLAGEMEHALLFDGANHYNKDFIEDKLVAELCLGSGDSDKSSELFSKIIASISAKSDFELSEKHGFGAYKTMEIVNGEPVEVIKPSPLYRDFVGNTTPPNKKNPYRYNYAEEVNGRWTLTGGTGSKLYHVNYSDKKADGAQAGAGGRYLMSLIEEGGLLECIEAVNRSNDSTVAREGIRFGSEFYIGTSGNLMKVGGFRKMMENPQDYSIYPLKNKYGTEGKDGMIGFFLPFYMTLRQFKDKDGNTDFRRAAMYVEVIRKEKAKSSDPDALRLEKMNRPCWMEEMWLSLDGNIMPYQELDDRERELLAFNNYEFTEKCVRLVWDSTQTNGVKYILDDTLEPFREFPVNMSKRKSPHGCVVLYELPMNIGGGIPDDMYCFIGHDPYVEQDLNKGGSIGSTYILMNPKYCEQGAKGNTIVAAYNDKPLQGLDKYYDNQMKLLALYGNPQRGLWFEKNRGDYCRSYYVGKNQSMLLAPTPQWTQGTNMFAQRITSYGYTVGNKLRKIELAKLMRDWLLEETTLADGTKKNVERLNDLFLIRQLKVYNLEDNFDAVDGFRGCIVGLREHQRKMESEIQTDDRRKQQKVLKFYLNNDRIFKKPGR